MIATRLNAKEIVVPLGLLVMVGCMIVPLPGAVLDTLLCSNLLFALLLVIGALHVKDPLKVATLPSLLLMATMFRLALNLATTRAVLGAGHAGQAVEAFGSLVIHGSVIVGFVLFLLISLIQFIVVAKGAERVAEVSARFTLDAMPGKQMAIDAEIRSGLLDPESARRKRMDVQTESRFYGALDGAMKFVKGDAIAGLVIAFVNICGCLAIGVLVNDLDVEVAIRKYTVLTIGDGLLSQIPSLLNSIAAGLIVTRVQIDETSSLAGDLLEQLGQFTLARLFVAGAAFILGCLPGMPHLVLILVSVCLAVSVVLAKSQRPQEVSEEKKQFEPSLAEVVHIEVAQEMVKRMPPMSGITEALDSIRLHAFSEWGVVLQRVGLGVWRDATGSFRVLVRGMEVCSHGVIEGDDAWKVLLSEVREVVNSYRVELIDDGATRRALDYVERQIPDLVSGVVPAVLTLTQLTAILRSLLREGITTRHLDVILQVIAESGSKLGERQLLAEVRGALAPGISSRFAECGVIRGAVVEPVIDLVLGKAEEKGSLVPVELVEHICDQVGELVAEGGVVVASKRARAYLRDIVRVRWGHIPIIAHEEIGRRFNFQSLGQVVVASDEQRHALVNSL